MNNRTEYVEYGDIHSTDITYHQAIQELQNRSVIFTQIYHHPIITRRFYNEGKINVETGIHIYFADKDNKEVAYWTRIMNHLTIRKTPLIVSQDLRDAASFDLTIHSGL